MYSSLVDVKLEDADEHLNEFGVTALGGKVQRRVALIQVRLERRHLRMFLQNPLDDVHVAFGARLQPLSLVAPQLKQVHLAA